MTIEVMKLALNFLEDGMPADMWGMDENGYQNAITALRQALEQPKQFFYGQDPNILPAPDKGEINDK